MAWNTINEKKLKKILKQISGDLTDSEGELFAVYRVKGKGSLWCYSPTSKKFVLINRGTEAYVINENEEDSHGKVLIYASTGEFVIVDSTEIEPLGFN